MLRGQNASVHHHRTTFFANNSSYENGTALNFCRPIIETYSRYPKSQKSIVYKTRREIPLHKLSSIFWVIFPHKTLQLETLTIFHSVWLLSDIFIVQRNVWNTPKVYTQRNNKILCKNFVVWLSEENPLITQLLIKVVNQKYTQDSLIVIVHGDMLFFTYALGSPK